MKTAVVKFVDNICYEINIYQNIANYYILIKDQLLNSQIVVITNTTLIDYAKALVDNLTKNNCQVLLLTVADHENSKSRDIKEDLENKMLASKIERLATCIAFGGGVIGDLAGFIAATYMRGINYIQIPTTLLAMVDSSIGGKVAVNTPFGKNLIGLFYHPQQVLVNLALLNTLDKAQLINGLVEIIKICLTFSHENIAYIENNLAKIINYDLLCLEYLVASAIRLKIDVVSQDITEKSIRVVLNFGHTIAHALEKVSNYEVMHGYAVALGIIVEAKIAVVLKYLAQQDFIQLCRLFKHLAIDVNILKNYSVAQIIAAVYLDKKNTAGRINIVMLRSIGHVSLPFTQTVSEDIIAKSIELVLVEYANV